MVTFRRSGHPYVNSRQFHGRERLPIIANLTCREILGYSNIGLGE
jgi:hypothetical protein